VTGEVAVFECRVVTIQRQLCIQISCLTAAPLAGELADAAVPFVHSLQLICLTQPCSQMPPPPRCKHCGASGGCVDDYYRC
jgi:hypothetical protein